jgi:hypothetical protein
MLFSKGWFQYEMFKSHSSDLIQRDLTVPHNHHCARQRRANVNLQRWMIPGGTSARPYDHCCTPWFEFRTKNSGVHTIHKAHHDQSHEIVPTNAAVLFVQIILKILRGVASKVLDENRGQRLSYATFHHRSRNYTPMEQARNLFRSIKKM